MKTLLTWIVLFLGLLQPTAAISQERLKIGALMCQTGTCAEWGSAALKGAQLAVEEVNSAGGVLGASVELIVEDSAEDQVKESLTAYRSLRNKGVDLIVGPTWSAAGNVIAAVAKSDPSVLLVSPSIGIRDFNEAGPNLFNIWPHDEYGARRLATFAHEQGLRRIAIFATEQPWSIAQAHFFREEFERAGGTITVEVVPSPDQLDLRSEANRIVRSRPEAVVFTCFSEQMGLAAKKLKQLGFKGVQLSVLMFESAISVANGALEGVVYAALPAPSVDFTAKFKRRFGGEPGTSADKGYDGAMLVMRAAIDARSSAVDAVRIALQNTTEYSGASGKLAFNAERAVSQVPVIFTVAAGRLGVEFLESNFSVRAQLGKSR